MLWMCVFGAVVLVWKHVVTALRSYSAKCKAVFDVVYNISACNCLHGECDNAATEQATGACKPGTCLDLYTGENCHLQVTVANYCH